MLNFTKNCSLIPSWSPCFVLWFALTTIHGSGIASGGRRGRPENIHHMSDIGWTWGEPQGGRGGEGGNHEQVKHWLSSVLIPYGEKFWQTKIVTDWPLAKISWNIFFYGLTITKPCPLPDVHLTTPTSHMQLESAVMMASFVLKRWCMDTIYIYI